MMVEKQSDVNGFYLAGGLLSCAWTPVQDVFWFSYRIVGPTALIFMPSPDHRG